MRTVLAIVMSPGPTTVIGQIGGAWGVWRGWSYERAVAAVPLLAMLRRLTAMHGLDGRGDRGRRSGSSFESGICSWLELLGELAAHSDPAVRHRCRDWIRPVLLGWAVFQAVTLCSVGGLVARCWPRWEAACKVVPRETIVSVPQVVCFTWNTQNTD